MRKILAIICAALVAISLFGCSTPQEEVQVVLMALDSDYWRSMKAGAEAAGADLGLVVEVSAPAKETDVLDQVNLIEIAASKSPKALIVAPCDPDMVVSSLSAAKEAGINTVLFDSDVAEGNRDCRTVFVGISNYDAAYDAGSQIVPYLYDGATVLVINKNPAATDHADREQGFVDALKEAYPNLNVVVKVPDEDARTSSYTIVEDFLSVNQVDLIYGTAADIVSGAIEAIDDKDVQVVGFDVEPATEGYLDAGKQLMCIDQDPYNIGYEAVKAAVTGNVGEQGILYLPATLHRGSKQ